MIQWQTILDNYFSTPKGKQLMFQVEKAYQQTQVYPPKNLIFNALHLTPFEAVRVVILGQDPYHNEGQAHGLAFSVPKGVLLPPSLRNIYKELEDDLGISGFDSGDLTHWAKQGILLLNTSLTVEAHQANSHQHFGWSDFTDHLIKQLSEYSKQSLIFVLWGKPAQAKKQLIASRHVIIEAPHPSPLSAYRGFFGSKPFSKINQLLKDRPIKWKEE